MELYTPYKAAQMVNGILKANDLPEIPPQMVYNYVGKGYIKSTLVDGKKRVTVEAMDEWLTKYLAKKGITITTEPEVTEEEQAELDLDAEILAGEVEDPNTTELADAAAL